MLLTRLLLALPIDRASFDRRLEFSDFLQRYRLLDCPWETYEAENAERCAVLATRASCAGVTVVQNACLDDLTEATSDATIVIFVSHWKGPEVGPDDLVGDLEFFRSRIDDESAAGLWFKRALRGKAFQDLTEVRVLLNDFVDRYDALASEHGFEVKATPFALSSANRDVLDSLFAPGLVPGNRVEFADGLKAKEDVSRAVSSGFRGILDLTTCTSTYLSDYLSRQSRGRYRTVQFDREQIADLSCLLLERTCELASAGAPYIVARNKASADLISGLALSSESSGARSGVGAMLRRMLSKIGKRP